jgi:hypothetical protein
MKSRIGCLVLGLVFMVLSMAAQTSSVAPAITGSGTKDHLAIWVNSSKLGNSKLFQSAEGEVGIGTTSPTATLDVNGTVNAATSFNLGGTAFAFGSYANQNAFFGFAGNATMTGGLNTAIGYQALFVNTTGYDNTATGYAALVANTTGYANAATGYAALANNTSGVYNTAVGQAPLVDNTTGSFNTAIGGYALYDNTNGNENTAEGASALYDNTSGYDNTAVGRSALYTNTTGDDLTCIGYDCSVSADGLTNATAIGAHAAVGQSNSFVLGGTGNWGVRVGIGTTTPSNILTIGRGLGQPVSDSWETYSSRRWKTNIQTLHGALAKVEQLRGVSYDLKDSGKHEVGVIAEEVGEVVPEIVTWDENGKDAQGVDYGRLTALLIEAMKEQQALIHWQIEKIELQQAKIARLDSQVKAIKTAFKTDGRTRSAVRTVKAHVPVVQQ